MSSYIIDARADTAHFPGIGRYVRGLLGALPNHLERTERLYLLRSGQVNSTPHSTMSGHNVTQHQNNVRIATASASPLSLSQQWKIPHQLRKLRAAQRPADDRDKLLYHSPYYVMPYRPGIPAMLTVYDFIPILYPETVSWRARWLFRLTMYLALHTASRVITISEATRNDLLAHFAFDPNAVVTIPLAPDLTFHPQSASEQRRVLEKYGLPAAFIFYLGINKPHKNLVRLIQAYATLDLAAPPLVISGAWDDRYPESRQLAVKLELDQRVRFLGPVDDADLPALYSACTLFVFPSVYEGFGLPVLEAMACGSAVVCSNRSSLPEVAGDAALLFEPSVPMDIAGSIRKVLDDPTLHQEMQRRSLVQASRFSWDETAQLTLEEYRRAIAY